MKDPTGEIDRGQLEAILELCRWIRDNKTSGADRADAQDGA